MIVVVGAGAVGCYYAGLIAKSGQTISLLAKTERAAALHKEGLTIQWADHSAQIDIQVTDDYRIIEQADVVLLCLKTTQSANAAKAIKPFLKPNTLLLSMQNGLNNAHELSSILAQPVYVAMIYAALAMGSEVLVSHQGGGQLVLGNPQSFLASEKALEDLARIFQHANCPVSISENIVHDLWSKWIINCAINGLSALGQINYRELFAQTLMPEIIEQITSECFTLAKAEGVRLNEALIRQQIASIPTVWPRQKSSMAQDLAAKKPSEIDALNGLAHAKGQTLGIATPMNTLLTGLVQLQERLY